MSSITADRELRIERLLDAPRDLVFNVWTDPGHIARWWGPDGFTTTIHHMDVRAGGKWNLTMHGPDGTDYRNESVFAEVIRPERLVFDHISGPKFRATVTFEAKGNKTLLTWVMLFDTAMERDRTVQTFGADKGLRENVEKLSKYLVSAG